VKKSIIWLKFLLLIMLFQNF